MPDIKRFPEYFENYKWSAKHSLYGYPEDSFPKFEWIAVLEQRFQWLHVNFENNDTASIYLLKEMIQWGGSQNGTLQKFEDGAERVNLRELMQTTIDNLNDPENAISAAMKFPGMGLTYASKLLRFLDPDRYGALDSRIRGALRNLEPRPLPNIYDGNVNSMIDGYVAFIGYIESIKTQLNGNGIKRPECGLGANRAQWRAADIEMALFVWAARNEP